MKVDGVTKGVWLLNLDRLTFEVWEVVVAFLRNLTTLSPPKPPWKYPNGSVLQVIKSWPQVLSDRSERTLWIETPNSLGPIRPASKNMGGIIGLREVEDPPGTITTYATRGVWHDIRGSWGIACTANRGGPAEVARIKDGLTALFSPFVRLKNPYATELVHTPFSVTLWDGTKKVAITEARLKDFCFNVGLIVVDPGDEFVQEGQSEAVYQWRGNISFEVLGARVEQFTLV